MQMRGKKLGLLLSTSPTHPNFSHGLNLAETALAEGVDVFLYCIDEAVKGLGDPRLQGLKQRGLKLYGCAFSAIRHNVSVGDQAIFSGLTLLDELISRTDRFVSFN